LLSARMRVAIRVADRERAPANARGQGMWATAAGCGWRAAHAPVIEYPAPSRRPIIVHIRTAMPANSHRCQKNVG